jgi:leucyl/phenylalanyl-tRNA--protein transferase
MRNPAFPEPYPFPDPALADEDGLLALGVPVTPANLRAAYARGIFPWPFSARHPVPWVSPSERAVLEFDHLHVPKTLRQALRRASWTFTIDHAFESVMASCAAARRPGQRGTWITPAMRAGYAALHHDGGAHSVEVWAGERLVGGLYGVDAGGLFTGESMFHLEPNASKLALLHLVKHLAARGADWIDIQQLTPHFAALGARVITREEFLLRLVQERGLARRLF